MNTHFDSSSAFGNRGDVFTGFTGNDKFIAKNKYIRHLNALNASELRTFSRMERQQHLLSILDGADRFADVKKLQFQHNSLRYVAPQGAKEAAAHYFKYVQK
jgi:hypothetical protein